MSLNSRQAMFAAEYLADLNATAAAERAGYSAKTAYSQGQRLLSHVEVQAAIQAGMKARGARTQITADRVLQEVGRIAFADIRKVVRWGVKEIAVGFDGDGKRLDPSDLGDAVMVHTEFAPFVEPVNSDELDDDTAAAIAEVAMTKDGIRIKMHGKVEAINLAGRNLAMWKDKLEVAVDEDTATLLAKARERAKSE
jgi:phage terminase small subunit